MGSEIMVAINVTNRPTGGLTIWKTYRSIVDYLIKGKRALALSTLFVSTGPMPGTMNKCAMSFLRERTGIKFEKK